MANLGKCYRSRSSERDLYVSVSYLLFCCRMDYTMKMIALLSTIHSFNQPSNDPTRANKQTDERIKDCAHTRR